MQVNRYMFQLSAAGLLLLSSSAYANLPPRDGDQIDAEIFQNYDYDSNGLWSLEEFADYSTANDPRFQFDLYDTNNDGGISLSEYQAGMCCA